ncbi:protein DPCD [Anthonomus grandis grandis]|uniref:protein DPCD n=1 Tax=Anthonomus grandis grandis TaxID=2921223 RepID=UPI0021656DBC|nr:protein DPCD [Anthonomus grandis grandis]
MTDWFSKLQNAKKTCLVEKNLKKVHYDFGDGKELVEEYDLTTNCIVRRAWKCSKGLKDEGSWEIEVGDPEPVYNAEEKCMIRENVNQPFVTRRITKLNLEWRIRNLPYPIDVYSVSIDKESHSLIIKTTNKKYYKKLLVTDLERLDIELEQESVTFSHKFNTLIITYKKPKKLLEFERALMEEVKKVKPKSFGEGVNECKPS